MISWTQEQLDNFQAAVQSLKLYRRAELFSDDGDSMVEALYVDPLPHEHVFKTLMRPNTTFVIGRKGTGKSTIFQRAQHELRKNNNATSAYIDIKTVFEQAQIDPELLEKVVSNQSSIPREALERLLLYRAFIHALVQEIRSELTKRLKGSIWERIKTSFTGNFEELFVGLDELLDEANSDKFISVLGLSELEVQKKDLVTESSSDAVDVGVNIGPKPGLKGSLSSISKSEIRTGANTNYADILIRVFDVKSLITQLKTLLQRVSVKHLHIYVDDFSELPKEAMMVVVDALLAPLNNWSDEFIKLKVAAYPGRVYYGQIDKTKIDEVYLDVFKLYGSTDVSAMEEKAIEFTRRLVDRRVRHYCGCAPETFIPNKDDIYKLLYFASMANPRNLGYVLFYLYESNLLYDRPIGPKAIRDAARKYYEDKIEPYFAMNKFLHETFNERSSVFALRELLETIVLHAKEMRSNRDSALMSGIEGTPPTSHFHVLGGLEALLLTLELNFFLTKYYEMSDRDGRKVSVFALNFGLCQKYSIEFGRPDGKREYRLYFVERIFDYTSILNNYMKTNQEIRCVACGALFALDRLDALKLFEMACPACKHGKCKVINLSKKYAAILEKVDTNLLLPATELGILQTLHADKKAMYPADIAAELDCSYQLVGKRGKILAERGLVDRKEKETRRVFSITKRAENTYFDTTQSETLDVPPDA
jgi:hypothetical protein